MSAPFGTDEAPYLVDEFFAGVGCAATGLGVGDGGRWAVAFANDFCTSKAKLHRLHHPGAPLRVGDICRVIASSVPWADLWWVSSPCTDLSTAGKRKGMQGAQSSLAFVITRQLRRALNQGRLPPILCFENVPGLLRHGAGMELLIDDIRRCGYFVGIVVVDAASWLPASRERVFILAVRKDVPVPPGLVADGPVEHCHPAALVRAHAGFDAALKADWVWWSLPPAPARTLRLEDLLEDVPQDGWSGEAVTRRFTDLLKSSQRGALAAAKSSGRTVYGVIVEKTDPDQPDGLWTYDGKVCKRRLFTLRVEVAFTLLASASGRSRQKLVVIDGPRIRIRDFTPREIARLLGVPDDLPVPGTPGLAMRSFGDAVAIPVVRELAQHLLEPLAAAARRASEAPDAGTLPADRAPRDGRRPIKARTKGVVTYLTHSAHAAIRTATKAEGSTLTRAMLDALDLWAAARGLGKLPRYEPAPRKARARKRRAGARPKARKGGRRKAGRPATRSVDVAKPRGEHAEREEDAAE